MNNVNHQPPQSAPRISPDVKRFRDDLKRAIRSFKTRGKDPQSICTIIFNVINFEFLMEETHPGMEMQACQGLSATYLDSLQKTGMTVCTLRARQGVKPVLLDASGVPLRNKVNGHG